MHTRSQTASTFTFHLALCGTCLNENSVSSAEPAVQWALLLNSSAVKKKDKTVWQFKASNSTDRHWFKTVGEVARYFIYKAPFPE